MKKKFISIILLIIICLSLVLTFASCWDDSFPKGDNDDVTTPPDAEDPDDVTTPPDNVKDPDDVKDPNVNTKPDPEPFEDYGMNVITVVLANYNVNEYGVYNTKEEVGAYIYLYHKLPSNYNTSSTYVRNNYNSTNKLSYTGGTFQNREGLLPKASGRTFTECDIGYNGGSRNALRIVFSSDFLIFYTSDHYASFSIMRFV